MGQSKGWITQLLDGEKNKTIRTVADVFAVLGREFCGFQRPIQIQNIPPAKSRTKTSAHFEQLETRGLKVFGGDRNYGAVSTSQASHQTRRPVDLPLTAVQ